MQDQRPGRGAAAADHIVLAVPAELKSLMHRVKDLIGVLREQVRAGRAGCAVDYAETGPVVQEKTSVVERALRPSSRPSR